MRPVLPRSQGKGRGRPVIAVARNADCIMMVLDASKGDEQRHLLEKELEACGIRLNKRKPNIYFKIKPTGGIKWTTTVTLTKGAPAPITRRVRAFVQKAGPRFVQEEMRLSSNLHGGPLPPLSLIRCGATWRLGLSEDMCKGILQEYKLLCAGACELTCVLEASTHLVLRFILACPSLPAAHSHDAKTQRHRRLGRWLACFRVLSAARPCRHCCECLIREDCTVDDFIDVLEGNRRWARRKKGSCLFAAHCFHCAV